VFDCSKLFSSAVHPGDEPKDRENYVKLAQELREAFQREHEETERPRLLLTMAVPAQIEKGFDIPKLNKYLDWFNVLSFDYHSAYEASVNHHAPLYPIEGENGFDRDLNIVSRLLFMSHGIHEVFSNRIQRSTSI
jgi:chitinase